MTIKLSKKESVSSRDFQKKILSWFDLHGRKHLPWQAQKTPYRVWVSEIMLQQTQVSTVIPYFQRFMERFPRLEDLAEASQDEVLHLWTGLGYYSRARNLHKSARIIGQNAAFPDNLQDLEKLPGIGRSTAGAILSIAFEKPAAILDGNVKRVLARLHALEEWPGEKKTLEKLWTLAEYYKPKTRTADYSQAMMDIGATICTRSKPHCRPCPLKDICQAKALGLENQLPKKKPSKSIPTRQVTMLVLQSKTGNIYLEKREAKGIWGGLWSLPEIKDFVEEKVIRAHCKKRFAEAPQSIAFGTSFRHTFTHFHLEILPVFVKLNPLKGKRLDPESEVWYKLSQPKSLGLPAPVKALLSELSQ